jgi:hypothetical protein
LGVIKKKLTRAKRKAAAAPEAVKRRANGSFARGQSGNPAGRAPGSRNKITVLCHDLLASESAGLVKVLIKKAREGDGLALKLCIERLVPIAGQRDRVIDSAVPLPLVEKAEDLARAAAAVIAGTAAGTMSLGEAEQFMRLLEAHRRILETTELVVRLEALEAAPPSKAFGFATPAVSPELAARVRHVVGEGKRA